jgi:hypothetical protein
MWWKRDRKTDLFASVAMFAAAGGAAGPTGGADVGPSNASGGIGPGGGSDQTGGDGPQRDTSPTTQMVTRQRTLNPQLSAQGQQQGATAAEDFFDQQVQAAIDEARGNFEQAAAQRGLSMQDTTRLGGQTIENLFNEGDVQGRFDAPSDFGQFVSPGVGSRTESVTVPQGQSVSSGTFQTDEFDINRDPLRQRVESNVPGQQFGQNILGQAQQRVRGELSQELEDIAPTGFAENRIGTNFGQSDIDAILNEQFNQARGVLENAGARGQITDQGFSSGIEAIGGQRETAQAELSDAAQGIRGNLRQSLRDRAGRARENASNFELGGNFNPQDVGQQLQSIEQRGAENFRGNLRGDVSIDELFSPEEAITTAGSQQGQANQGRLSLIGALQNRNRRPGQGNRERGLGTQGSF